MLHNISETIASFFVQKQFITKEQLTVYTYCFEFLLSILLFWTSIFLLAWVTGSIIPTLFYYVTFYIFRTAIGGYHAKTHLRCYILSMLTFSLFLIISHVLQFFAVHMFFTLPLLILSGILIWRYAPIEHSNRPFTSQEYLKFRKRSRILLVAFSVVILGLHYSTQTQIYGFYVVYGITQAVISLLAAYKLTTRKELKS
ncbi:MAG: accessory gene regulator B family protein [Peptococcaceae bacterium]|nr:accessory gene regulator B family protein [Peptococcaceae bacterium]